MFTTIRKIRLHVILPFICGMPLIAACSPSLNEKQAAAAISSAIKSKIDMDLSFVTYEAKGFPGGTVEAACQTNPSGNVTPGTCKFALAPNLATLQNLHKLGYVNVSDKPIAKQSQGGPSYYTIIFSEDLQRIQKPIKKGKYSDRLVEQIEYRFNSGEFESISITSQTKPADFMGQKITKVYFSVPYTYNSVAARVLNSSSKNYKGQATFVLHESGWVLSEYVME